MGYGKICVINIPTKRERFRLYPIMMRAIITLNMKDAVIISTS